VFPAVLAHHVGRQVGLIEQLAHPLARRDDGRREDQRVGLDLVHDAEPHQRFPGATRQHDNPASAPRRPTGVEDGDGFVLIIAQREGEVFTCRVCSEGQMERRTVDIARQILGGVTELKQRLLDTATVRLVDDERAFRCSIGDERSQAFVVA